MNIIDLAITQVRRERKNPEKNLRLVIDRAFTIRKYMDLQERNKKVAISRYNKV